MKKIIFLIVIKFFTPLASNSQQLTTSCIDDSIANRAFTEYLSYSTFESADYESTYYKFLSGRYADKCNCKIIMFAHLFDHMLSNGLDLNYDIERFVELSYTINLSFDSMTQAPSIDPDFKRFKKKYIILIDFLNIKETYEHIVEIAYRNTGTVALSKDIDNTINNGLYNYPKTVGDILKLKYKSFTRESLDQRYQKAYEALKGKKN